MATEAELAGGGRFIRTARGELRCACCGTVRASPRRDRAFTIVDAMALVAALALAFVVVRPIAEMPPIRGLLWARILAHIVAVLMTLTPTTLLLRLRAPRPTPRRLWRQPGFAASVAASGIIGLGVLTVAGLALIRFVRAGARAAAIPGRPAVAQADPYWWVGVVIYLGPVVGVAVIGIWLVLWLGKLRRPSAGWIDLLGRLLGIVWIGIFVVDACLRLSRFRG